MKREIFTIGKEPFSEWAKRHSDASSIVISGAVSIDEIGTVFEGFDYNLFEEITLRISIKELDDEDWEDVIITISHWNDDDVNTPMEKMVVNTDRFSVFTVKDGVITSDEGRALIHVPEATELIVPEEVTHIGHLICNNYTKLSELKLNERVEEIGCYAFAHTEISSLKMPDSLKRIGVAAFYQSYIEHIVWSENLEAIPDKAFGFTGIEELHLSSSIKTIGWGAFSCAHLDYVEIPEGVEEIGSWMCSSIERIKLPSTLMHIAPDFYYEYQIDEPDCPPYVEISENNPVYYSKEGNLYYRKDDCLALDWDYKKRRRRYF